MKFTYTPFSFWINSFALLVLASVFMSPQAHAKEKPNAANPEDNLRFEIQVVADAFDSNYQFDPKNPKKANGDLKVRRGQVVSVVVTGTASDGFHTYPITKRTSTQPPSFMTKFEVVKVAGVEPLWPIVETEPEKHLEKVLGTYFEHFKTFNWVQEILISADAAPGMVTVPIKVETQVCDDNGCTPIKRDLKVSFEVTKDEPLSMAPELKARLALKKPSIEVVAIPGEKPWSTEPTAYTEGPARVASEGSIRVSHEKYKGSMEDLAKAIKGLDKLAVQGNETGLLGFILTGIFWGAISLVTPCVFPMIPITVSFFLKQSEKEHHRPIVMASVYSLTIVVVLTVAASSLLTVFQKLSILPITNYFIGGLFIFFALSLFGMYEIELPHSLAQFTSAREGKGGIEGTIFMALTFTIISFACVAPFLGGFGGTAAEARPWWHNILGGLAFSTTFASPFFFLALFPALLRKMPKSGSWLNSVKVVMGFLELAAAFKFFRTAELIQAAGAPSFFTFDLILGLWIAMSILCGIYLIGLFRLPHDTPEEHVTVPRLLVSAAFLGLAFYLTPALFKVNAAGQPQRPGGTIYAWIDSFLLPDARAGEGEIPSSANLEFAVTQARDEFKRTGKPKRIFIDFTGVTCTNCKINEQSVFSKPEFVKLFAPYHFVKLYTDTVPAEYYASELARDVSRSIKDAEEVNFPFRNKVFDSKQLPLYVILEPQLDGEIRILGIYPEGRINNQAAFAEFLRNPDKK